MCWAAGIILPFVLLSCSGLHYVRSGEIAGSRFVDRLILSGQSFRLERSDEEGTLVYDGRYSVKGEMWSFEILSWRSAHGPSHPLDPPLLFVCRGRSFENGLAFFAPADSHGAQVDVFLNLPSDFDLERWCCAGPLFVQFSFWLDMRAALWLQCGFQGG